MLRFADLIAVLALAVVVLLPKASIEARPALDGEPLELDRVAHLQDDVLRDPHDVEAQLALADAFLSFARPDWTIASLSRFVAAEDHGEAWAGDRVVQARVHLSLATARAERLEAEQAVAEVKRVEERCAGAPGAACAGPLARAGMIGAAMKALVDNHIDPAVDPVRAKREVGKALRIGHAGFGAK